MDSMEVRPEAHHGAIQAIGNVKALFEWMISKRQDQLKMYLWSNTNQSSRQTCLMSDLDSKGERKNRLVWGAIPDISDSGDSKASTSPLGGFGGSQPKNNKKNGGFGAGGFGGGGFGGGFGMGNRSFRLIKSGAKPAPKPKDPLSAGSAAEASVKIERPSSGFTVASQNFRFPKELMDPNLTAEEKSEILVKLRSKHSNKKTTLITNSKSEEESKDCYGGDVHVCDYRALLQSMKTAGLVDSAYSSFRIAKNPKKKGWNLKTGWILSQFISLSDIIYNIQFLRKKKGKGNRIGEMLKSFEAKLINEPTPSPDGKYTTHFTTFSFNWEALKKKHPGFAKFIGRVGGFNIAFTDTGKKKVIAEASYDGKTGTLKLNTVTNSEGMMIWFNSFSKSQGAEGKENKKIKSGTPYIENGSFITADVRFGEPVRVNITELSLKLLGINFSLPSTDFIMFRKLSHKGPVDSVDFARVEVHALSMEHTFMSSLLAWMLGVEKLFEYYIKSYRCTFGFAWPTGKAKAAAADDFLDSVWKEPGAFTVTFEADVPPSKTSKLHNMIEKQIKKEKYIGAQKLVVKVIQSLISALTLDS